MKKTIIILAAIFCFAFAANAQPRAIGIRGGYGAEFSYQHSLGDNFVEADLGWTYHGTWLTGIYDFLFPIQDGFNFYAGPGARIGAYSYKDDNRENHSGFDLGIAGQVGIEYNFNIPLQLSLDWRPAFTFIDSDFDYFGLSLGVRYRF
jgi:hypothetical protein